MIDKRADSVREACPLFQKEGGGVIPTSALHLKIGEIEMRKAQKLNMLWHSVLPETHLGNLVGKPRSVAYAAEYDGIFYAVAIWTDPIAANRIINGWKRLELRRLAIADDAPPNTASRMLGIMARLVKKKWPDLIGLLSYQSIEHHKGTIYKAAGWTATHIHEFQEWKGGKGRSRRPQQIQSNKIRWERTI
jgi:hypothetical protein